ncbi:hypothetical protein HYDPIDRAFT_108673 [Hydnomerulius pinastri MD-312]|nr:hypothetical protein HYDPIDRAFT_108673 [Hydnomerulius pinastri MD-312]
MDFTPLASTSGVWDRRSPTGATSRMSSSPTPTQTVAPIPAQWSDQQNLIMQLQAELASLRAELRDRPRAEPSPTGFRAVPSRHGKEPEYGQIPPCVNIPRRTPPPSPPSTWHFSVEDEEPASRTSKGFAAKPEKYDGNKKTFNQWMRTVQLYIWSNPDRLPNNRAKILFALSYCYDLPKPLFLFLYLYHVTFPIGSTRDISSFVQPSQ